MRKIKILTLASIGFALLSSIFVPKTLAQGNLNAQNDPVSNVEVTIGSDTAFALGSGTIYRDSVDTIPVTIKCLDKNKTLVANRAVTISMSNTSVATVSPTTATTDGNGNVSVTVTSADVNSAGTTDKVTATSEGVSGSGVVTLNGVSLVSVDVVSGASAAKSDVPSVGDKNWAALQSAGQYAQFKVTTQPDLQPVWNAISWGSGVAVTGSGNNYRNFDISASVKDSINPTITGSGLPHGNYLWIIWGTLTLSTNGTAPAGAPDFSAITDGTNQLGCVTGVQGGVLQGFGKYVVTCKLTPAGIHTVVTSGFNLYRIRNSVFIDDGVLSTTPHLNTNGNYVPDQSGLAYMNLTPDASDQIYDVDAPNTVQDDVTNKRIDQTNFQETAQWNSITCSNTIKFYYMGEWQLATPHIVNQQLGIGSPSFPTP